MTARRAHHLSDNETSHRPRGPACQGRTRAAPGGGHTGAAGRPKQPAEAAQLRPAVPWAAGRRSHQEAQRPMNQAHTTGDRIRDIRKRRGLTQRALAESSGVSLSLIKKLEQGDYGDVRLETLHKLAVTLRVPTSALATQPDAEEPEREDVKQWAPVRHALEGTSAGDEPAEEPTLDGLTAAFADTVPLLVANQYG